MPVRSSVVDNIHLTTLLFSSVFNIGDVENIASRANVLAVQHTKQFFFLDEYPFLSFPIFSEPLHFQLGEPGHSVQTFHVNPVIHVGNLSIIGTSASAVIQIGSLVNGVFDSRVRHIRHIENIENVKNMETKNLMPKDV
ncbi:spore germination protein GerPE [Bacillus sp. FSL W8-0102]|uniref:spore germination protein GerPE n=1 Tax=Bacillus sp. FSL W8-0102 TaxID=2978205 RepID=UPI0030F9B11D